jgi:hypothetical protein
MVKAAEKEKLAVATVAAIDEAVGEIGSGRVIGSFNKLLDSRKHWRPPAAWQYFGPADQLLKLMHEAVGSEDLPPDVDQMIEFLKQPAVARLVRAANILISFPPHPQNGKEPMIRLERLATDEYRSLTA